MSDKVLWLSIDRLTSTNDIKVYLKLGNITIGVTKKINWFQEFMYNLFFGIKVEKVGRQR